MKKTMSLSVRLCCVGVMMLAGFFFGGMLGALIGGNVFTGIVWNGLAGYEALGVGGALVGGFLAGYRTFLVIKDARLSPVMHVSMVSFGLVTVLALGTFFHPLLVMLLAFLVLFWHFEV